MFTVADVFKHLQKNEVRCAGPENIHTPFFAVGILEKKSLLWRRYGYFLELDIVTQTAADILAHIFTLENFLLFSQ